MQQLALFDGAAYADCPLRLPHATLTLESWPVGPLSHPQFDYGRDPQLFGGRDGFGPLLVAPDTNLVVHLIEAFDRVESDFGLFGPPPAGDRERPVEALRELFVLWFHFDLRWVVLDECLTDAKRPLTTERFAARVRVLNALRADLGDRGGLLRSTAQWDVRDEEARRIDEWQAADHWRLAHSRDAARRIACLVPGHDGVLVSAALCAGCHVFLTEDRGILAKTERLAELGISVLRPGQLLNRLDDLKLAVPPPDQPLIPDLLPLAHFYALTADS